MSAVSEIDGFMFHPIRPRIVLKSIRNCKEHFPKKKCACGTVDTYYAQFYNNPDAHLQAGHFGIDRDGKLVLMTMDHILPKSFGGANRKTNLRSMCDPCNRARGIKLEESEVENIKNNLHLYLGYSEESRELFKEFTRRYGDVNWSKNSKYLKVMRKIRNSTHFGRKFDEIRAE